MSTLQKYYLATCARGHRIQRRAADPVVIIPRFHADRSCQRCLAEITEARQNRPLISTKGLADLKCESCGQTRRELGPMAFTVNSAGQMLCNLCLLKPQE